MNENNKTDLAPAIRTGSLLAPSNFDMAQRMATALSRSTLIPQEFRNNLPNCLIALEMSHRMGASPMMVMQNLYIVHGKPAWSSQFIIAAINSTGKFSPLRFEMVGEGDKRACTAWAIEHGTKEKLEGPTVSIAMAKAEGWYGKNGSKWQTIPELMLRYRAATFFGRLYAPEVLMGMKEETEIIDVDAEVMPGPAIEKPTFTNGAVKDQYFDGPGNGHAESEPPKKLTIKKTRGKAKPKSGQAPPQVVQEKPKPTDPSPMQAELAAAKPKDPSKAGEIVRRLMEAGRQTKDLINVALSNEWMKIPEDYVGDPYDIPLDKLSPEELDSFLAEWPTVAEQIDALPVNE